jgi:hypothetical protein
VTANVAFGGGDPPIPLSNGVVVVVSPIGPDVSVVVVLVAELAGVVEGDTPIVVVVAEVAGVVEGETAVVVVTELGGVVGGETAVLVVVVTGLGGVVEGETAVVVVTAVVVEVVVALGTTLNPAVAQISDPRRQAVTW